MAGFSNKLKNLTKGILRKKGSNGQEGSPFDSQASPFDSPQSPFAAGPPDFGDATNSPGGTTSGSPAGPSFGAASSFPSPPGAGGPGGESPKETESVDNKQVSENAEKIKALETKLSKVDTAISTVQRESQSVKTTVEKIDQSVLELLSLYELVSNQVNPFVGDELGGRATIERFDKAEKRIAEVADFVMMLQNEVEGLSQSMQMPGLPAEAESKIEDITTKMDVFADSLVTLQESVTEISYQVRDAYERQKQLDMDIVDIAQTTSTFAGRIGELEKIDLSELQEKVEQAILKRSQATNGELSNQTDEYGEPIREGKQAGEKAPIVRLESIKKNPMSVVVLLNWIEFLMERVGRNNLMDALDYYVDIGWISEEVRSEIMAYARGIDYYVEKPTWRLLPEDHTKSLLFIERLCGRKIDRNMLSMVDREMAKVKHGLEELYGI
ncbi:FlaD/FlaE family flagellar protein [Methanococcoides sp. AM1]|uniref:FlaD/FlaE family flagellar protein n=1 Tax=Methanococcoides sp. AM1 TaxID=1201011 RepID=UPI001083150F|nr:FlaD/FlaE family flagellar protein [Methanococcoides sp. AM1]